MIPAAALLLAAPQTAVEAERAFAAMAQRDGQWTAFRAYATADALMFQPQPVRAQALLKDAPDPKNPVMWWPAESWVSCDGATAVNSGPWVREGGRASGYFTTIWVRQADGGWKWIYDGGDALKAPRSAGERPKVTRARCGMPAAAPALPDAGGTAAAGGSADGSLRWAWTVAPDGTRRFAVTLARRPAPVLDQMIAP